MLRIYRETGRVAKDIKGYRLGCLGYVWIQVGLLRIYKDAGRVARDI